jgi:hypothetical protein
MKKKQEEISDDIRPEYDFDYSKVKRGKYHDCLVKEGQFTVGRGDYTKDREKWLKDITLDEVISLIKTGKKKDQPSDK